MCYYGSALQELRRRWASPSIHLYTIPASTHILHLVDKQLIDIDNNITTFSSVKKVNENDFVIKCRDYFHGITYVVELNLFTNRAAITRYKIFTNKIKSISYFNLTHFY